MTNPVTFTIPGRPYPKKRPRFSRFSGRAFDPKSNATTEDSIGTIALPLFPQPIAGPVGLTVVATFAAPASWTKAKRAALLGRPHTQRPDGDNLLKTVKDALNRIAWADDGQVSDARVVKVWGVVDRTVVEVRAL